MKSFFFLFFFATAFYSRAQLTIPATTSAEWPALVSLSKNYDTLKPEEYARYPVHHLKNGLFISMLGKIKPSADWSMLTNAGVLRGSQTGNIATIKVPLQAFAEIDFSTVFSYLELADRVQADLKRVIADVRADSVQLGINLPSAYTGKDVLIGITDWGFDYTHPMFYDTLLQETRIVAAWDQYKIVGNAPSGYSYGVEYEGTSELLAAGSDTANIYSYHTHGTHVGGIAGGSGAGIGYRGMAPEAGFLFTTFLVDNASVIDAFNWMKDKALSEDKRLVINMSWGLYYLGTLDGNSLLSQTIDQLSSEGVCFANSAGNNGDVNFHIKKTFNNDTLTSKIQFDSYSNPQMWGQSITMWGEPGHHFNAGIEVYNGSNTLVAATPLYATETAAAYLDSTLVSGNDTIFFNLACEDTHPLNDRPHMRLRVKNTHTSLKIILRATAENGIVHFWNVVELNNGVGNWGLPFTSFGGATGVGGDKNYSIGEPACTSSLISVAAYSSGYLSTQGNPQGGTIASFTSVGPLITEVMKPDIAAPGVQVVSSISSFTDADYTEYAATNFNGRDYDFAKFSGTSMSSPCVAGIIALMLDANPTLTPAEIKSILKNTARQDEHTGIITPPGDVRWGYGKVNAYAAVINALAAVGVQEIPQRELNIKAAPNPVITDVQIYLPEGRKALRVTAVSMEGKKIPLEVNYSRANCTSLSSGIYVLEVSDGTHQYYVEIAKQ